MIYRIHFNPFPIGTTDSAGTNYFIEERTGLTFVDWRILDTPAARAFVQSTKLILNNQEENEVSPKRWISWNCYKKNDPGFLCDELNNYVKYCITRNYIDFDTGVFVTMDLPKEEIARRLNAIHFEFEKDLEDKEHQLELHTKDYLDTLERLNKLVHEIENNINDPYHNAFYVVRHSSDHVRHKFVTCTDEIYDCFEPNTLNGDLFSDFFTVGKDLQHAFHSNDLELIHNNEVKQQSVISGSVAFACNEHLFGKSPSYEQEKHLEEYYNWCAENNVEDYGIMYKQSKYNYGRAPVGQLINHTYDSFQSLLEKNPFVTRIQLIDE